MNRLAIHSYAARVGVLVWVTWAIGAALAQEQSINPDINRPYRNPDVGQFVKQFEVESREVFAHRQEIVAACRPKPGMVVADIGAGTGLFTRLFATQVGAAGRVYAVDITAKFLEHIRKTCQEASIANVQTVQCTPQSVELPEGSIDLAFLCDVYHHLEFPQKTLASIYRALRPGGQLVLVDYRRIDGKSDVWLLRHVRGGQEVFRREIESAGFQQVEECTFLQENYLVRFEKCATGAASQKVPR